MKKIVFFSSIMLIGLASCDAKKTETPTETPAPKVAAHDMKGLKIAFYYSDSVKTGFEYFKTQEKIVNGKQKQFEKTLQQKQQQYQNYIITNNEKLQKGLLSENEQMQIQQKAQQMEADIMRYQQEQGGKLEKETMEKLEAISKKVEGFGKDFCEKHGIDLLLIHGAGGQLNYINPSMDVTKEFVAFLNEHQKEIENQLK